MDADDLMDLMDLMDLIQERERVGLDDKETIFRVLYEFQCSQKKKREKKNQRPFFDFNLLFNVSRSPLTRGLNASRPVLVTEKFVREKNC